MRRDRFSWTPTKPATTSRVLKLPFAMGFLAGLGLSAAVLIWPVRQPASNTPILFDADARHPADSLRETQHMIRTIAPT